MIEGKIPFWLVWNPAGFAPKYHHGSRKEAEQEAERLARANPGRHFYVLMPTCEIKHSDITVNRFDDDLPF